MFQLFISIFMEKVRRQTFVYWLILQLPATVGWVRPKLEDSNSVWLLHASSRDPPTCHHLPSVGVPIV